MTYNVHTNSAIGKCIYAADYAAFPKKHTWNGYHTVDNEVWLGGAHTKIHGMIGVCYLPEELYQ